MVVAPRFQTSDDDPESDEPFWSSAGWKRGHLSRPEGPSPRVQSCTVTRPPAAKRTPPARAYGFGMCHQSVHLPLSGSGAGGGRQGFRRPGRPGATTTTTGTTGSATGPTTPRASTPPRFGPGWCGGTCGYSWGTPTRSAPRWTRVAAPGLQGTNRFVRVRTLVRFMTALDAGHAHTEMIVPGVGHSSRSMGLRGGARGAFRKLTEFPGPGTPPGSWSATYDKCRRHFVKSGLHAVHDRACRAACSAWGGGQSSSTPGYALVWRMLLSAPAGSECSEGDHRSGRPTSSVPAR